MAWWNPRTWGRSRPESRNLSFQDVWGSGGDVAGIRAASVDTAITLAPVYSATRLLADSVASLPMQVYRQVGDTRSQIDTPMLLRDPSAFGTTYEWVQRAMASLLLRGNAYGMVTGTYGDGDPRRVEWLHPDDVTVDDNRTDGRPQWYVLGRPVDRGELIHVPGYVIPGQILGLSPIASYALTTEIGLLSQQFGRDWFRNSSVPAAVLETEHPVTDQQVKTVKERFRQAATGREPVVLGAGVEYKPIAVAPEESQFLATMKATATQIANIYGVPPEFVGGETGSSMTYETTEQKSINFATYTLRPYVTKLEQALSRLLPEPQYVRFNVDAMIRTDLKTRYEAHAIALQNGFKTPDEVRALEDLPPLPGGQGDTVRVPSTSSTTGGNESGNDSTVRRLRAASGDDGE